MCMEILLTCLRSFKYFMEWVLLLRDFYSLLVGLGPYSIPTTIPATIFTRIKKASREAKAIRTSVGEDETGSNKWIKEVKIVMEKLGISWADEDMRKEEILCLFEEDEPSLDEVKEAFDVFDVNEDGFIDANELQYVLGEMGFLRFSKTECRLMIDGYDVDNDERISLREFIKVMEDSFE